MREGGGVPAQPPAAGREKDGQKTCFQKQDVPLKTKEGLACDR